MSCEESQGFDGCRSMMDDQTKEPTYAEAFPPLPATSDAESFLPSHASIPGGNHWGKKMSLRSSTTTQVFSVPLEERRYREMTEQQFGEKGREQTKICSEIMSTTGVAIEMSLAKDQSLTVVISGKSDAVLKARKMIVQNLQTQSRSTIHIPKEHHRFILGLKGKKLSELELQTATKITIPRPGEMSDAITITGTKEGIEKARHEIQLISDEQAKLAFERIPIPKIYHPFICGPDNQTLKDLTEPTGARIIVPPHAVLKDEIVISGEKEGVLRAKQAILHIYEEKKRKTTTVSVEVKKSQHRYIIGSKGSGLNDVLLQTGVSVEVPLADDPSETITLRGDPEKLGQALTLVYSKANSIVIQEVDAPAWLHRFIIGRQGSNLRHITQNFPRVHIEFTDEKDHIRLEGPPDDVETAKVELETIAKDLIGRMAYVQLSIDPKYHKHIIGRNGANVSRLKSEHDVDIRLLSDIDSHIVRIEGPSEGVAKAKQELLEMVEKMENEKTRDIVIEQRLHRLIIGTQGGKIREIRDRFQNVTISVPDVNKKSDIILLRGPKNEVDRCYTYLQKLTQELIATNCTTEVKIGRQFYREVVGRNNCNIQKIRDETEARIDLPYEIGDSNTITITGRKEDIERAREMLETKIKEQAGIQEETVDIPHSLHNSLLAVKGQFIRAISDECGGVMIRFPSATSKSDKVLLRGSPTDVDRAKGLLVELANEKKESCWTAEIHARPEFHRFLIGRNGANVQELYRTTGARPVFPASSDPDPTLITIVGKQEAVNKAKAILETKIQDLEKVVEVEMNIDPKHHRHFIARKGELLRQISEEFGNVIISFPRIGVKSDKVVLKGARNCIEGAQQRIVEVVNELESRITIECVIPHKYHGLVMGSKGHRVQDITQEFNVSIRFPDRNANTDHQFNEETSVNGEGCVDKDPSVAEKASNKQDVILISGQEDKCTAAKEALLLLMPVTEEVAVAYDLHRYIIGQKGRDVRKMMDDYDVSISIPPADDKSDIVRITGPRANVDKAREALMERVQQLEDEKQQKVLKNFKLDVTVDPKYHPKIIGRRGATITKIRQQFDVQIQFPDKSGDKSDVITITGLEASANAARDEILKMVFELEDLATEEMSIDHRIHSRLIGSKGRGIHRIMDEFKVDIRFPGRDAKDPNLVVISGTEDAVLECREHLLNLEEEYLQDLTENELMTQYQHPLDQVEELGGTPAGVQTPPEGYTVRGAPWSAAAPDTSSLDDFPDLNQAASTLSARQIRWGPMGKR